MPSADFAALPPCPWKAKITGAFPPPEGANTSAVRSVPSIVSFNSSAWPQVGDHKTANNTATINFIPGWMFMGAFYPDARPFSNFPLVSRGNNQSRFAEW